MRQTLIALLLLVLGGLSLPALAQDPFNRPRPATPAAEENAPSAAPAGGGVISALIVDGQRQSGLELRRILVRLRTEGLTTPALLAGLIGAFFYGVLHTLGPGHGKAVVIGYFLGRQARPWRGLWMGTRIALTHVGGAIILAAIFWFWFGRQPAGAVEDLPAIRIIAALLLLGLGGLLLRDVLTRPANNAAACCDHHDHHHPGHHHHGHDHHESHHHGHQPRDKTNLAALVAGWVPCTGAVIVLLFCVANSLWLAGFLLVSAIATGMAVTMAVIGFGTMLLRRQVSGWLERTSQRGPAARVLDFAGPGLVIFFAIILLAVEFRLI